MRINAGSICMTLIWNVFFSWTVWEMKRRKVVIYVKEM